MTQMCGLGAFITIPLIVHAIGGPHALIAWILGALISMADGLVWAELGAAMPGAGATYLYLREAFQYRTGRLMPFLFVWTVLVATPLVMSTGVIGIVQYTGYFFPMLAQTPPSTGSFLGDLVTPQHLWICGLSVGVVTLVIVLLYRGIHEVGRLTRVLFWIMLLTVGLTILASFSHFHPEWAFQYPANAFRMDTAFWVGLGQGLIYATYDYAGYGTTACIAEEILEPGRNIPRSIIYSILGMMVIYLFMNVGIMGVVPWQQVADSSSIGSLVMERTWGKGAAKLLSALIIITGFGSLFTGLLGASRIPYNAAKDGLFFAAFAKLHPVHKFPHVGLLVMGVVTAVGAFFPLDQLISVLTAALVLIQGASQIVALTVLRRRQPHLPRPYRQWLYPLPSLMALIGWGVVFFNTGTRLALMAVGWIVLGVIAFCLWAWKERTWPFGPILIREPFASRTPPAAGGII